MDTPYGHNPAVLPPRHVSRRARAPRQQRPRVAYACAGTRCAHGLGVVGVQCALQRACGAPCGLRASSELWDKRGAGTDGVALFSAPFARTAGDLPPFSLTKGVAMETWILIVALLYKHPALPQATAAATQAEFASAEACNNALQKVKTEWGSPTGVGVHAVCVATGFKRPADSAK